MAPGRVARGERGRFLELDPRGTRPRREGCPAAWHLATRGPGVPPPAGAPSTGAAGGGSGEVPSARAPRGARVPAALRGRAGGEGRDLGRALTARRRPPQRLAAPRRRRPFLQARPAPPRRRALAGSQRASPCPPRPRPADGLSPARRPVANHGNPRPGKGRGRDALPSSAEGRGLAPRSLPPPLPPDSLGWPRPLSPAQSVRQGVEGGRVS